MSKKAQAKRFISHLSRIAATNYNSIFTKQQLRDTIKELGLQVSSDAWLNPPRN
jgi:DNA helicase MCM8